MSRKKIAKKHHDVHDRIHPVCDCRCAYTCILVVPCHGRGRPEHPALPERGRSGQHHKKFSEPMWLAWRYRVEFSDSRLFWSCRFRYSCLHCAGGTETYQGIQEHQPGEMVFLDSLDHDLVLGGFRQISDSAFWQCCFQSGRQPWLVLCAADRGCAGYSWPHRLAGDCGPCLSYLSQCRDSVSCAQHSKPLTPI